MLDAGHGGHDSGAVGPAGLMEKELVLDVTRRVAALVEDTARASRCCSRRDGDDFVPAARPHELRQPRAGRSLRVDPRQRPPRGRLRGRRDVLPVLGGHRQRRPPGGRAENSVVQLEKPAGRAAAATDVVKTILWDLAQSEFQQESSRLAEVVQDSMTQSLKIPNRGVKQAGFYVLGGAAMPAILIEIGFVTNPKEERRLKESTLSRRDRPRHLRRARRSTSGTSNPGRARRRAVSR